MLNEHKLTIIGLDGAAYPVVGNWIKKGYLPNLGRIAGEGIFTTLNSSFLPITPIAWTSITTGKNPGKHGIFDWSIRSGRTHDFDLITSRHCRVPRLWRILNLYGYTTGVFNVPITYPPEEVDGYLISGFDTPDVDSDFIRPSSLRQEFTDRVPDYRLFVEEGFTKGQEERYARALMNQLQIKSKAIDFLLDRFDTDFSIFVVMELDHLHHKLWRLVEQDHPLAVEVYRMADEIVGLILRKREGQNFMVVSDHGAGSLEGVVYVNRWLANEGLMKIRDSLLLRLKVLLGKTDLVARAYRILSRMGLGGLKRFLSKETQEQLATSFISFDDVVWTETKAFAVGEYGQIYVNRAEEYDGGTVSRDEYGEVSGRIIEGLRNIRDDKGVPMVDTIFRREDVYVGPHAALAPDLVFSFKGYAYDSSVRFGLGEKKVFGAPEFEDSGTHRREGIFLACGPSIVRQPDMMPLDILDITPTVLHMYGCPVAEDMDGRVASEVLQGDNLPVEEIAYTDAYPLEADRAVTSEKDDAEVIRKLKSLGYMD